MSYKSHVDVRRTTKGGDVQWGCPAQAKHAECIQAVAVALRYILGYSQKTSSKAFTLGKIKLQQLGNRIALFMTRR